MSELLTFQFFNYSKMLQTIFSFPDGYIELVDLHIATIVGDTANLAMSRARQLMKWKTPYTNAELEPYLIAWCKTWNEVIRKAKAKNYIIEQVSHGDTWNVRNSKIPDFIAYGFESEAHAKHFAREHAKNKAHYTSQGWIFKPLLK